MKKKKYTYKHESLANKLIAVHKLKEKLQEKQVDKKLLKLLK